MAFTSRCKYKKGDFVSVKYARHFSKKYGFVFDYTPKIGWEVSTYSILLLSAKASRAVVMGAYNSRYLGLVGEAEKEDFINEWAAKIPVSPIDKFTHQYITKQINLQTFVGNIRWQIRNSKNKIQVPTIKKEQNKVEYEFPTLAEFESCYKNRTAYNFRIKEAQNGPLIINANDMEGNNQIRR